jgi:metal-responsive CopG/Arc/MetJ family transcriptional regulator
MSGRTKVSVSVHTHLLREVERVAGDVSRSAIFDQALAHWLRERRQVQLEQAIEEYYNALNAGEGAESGDDTVRRVWSDPKR